MARPRRDGRPPREPNRRALTEMFVRQVRPAAEPYQVYDTKQGGLVLQVQPTGKRRWKVYYSHRGQPRWLDIGAADAIPLGDARRLAARVMLQVANGADPHAERMARRCEGTFGELAEAYLAGSSNKSKGQYEAQLRRWAIPAWGRMPAGAVTRADVRRLFDERKMASTSSAQLMLAAISSCFGWALHGDWAGVTDNPAKNIASVRHDKSLRAKSRTRVLSDAEVPLFWAAWEAAGLVRCTALRTILLTGQRPGEVRQMRWQDVENDFKGGAWWTLPGEPDGRWPGTKNAATHRVWLTPAVLAMLEDAGARQGLVFATARGNPVDNLDKAMRDACFSLGAEHATPHDLRRSHCTMVTRLGFGRDAMNRVSNHKEGGIADTYDLHTYADEFRSIQERVGAMVAQLVSGEPDSRVVRLVGVPA